MCEVNVYLEKNGKQKLIFKEVATITRPGEKWVLVNIFGKEKYIKGKIKEMKLLEHKIIFEEEK